MPKKVNTPKVVADPVYGIVDIRPVLKMVEVEEFQALGDKRQLGMAYLTFPSATHTRKAHSLGAYHATRELADQWIKLGFIGKKEADALAGYALYHDIGHPAFSHVTEPLCPVPKEVGGMSVNSAMSLAIIRKRRREIEACGIDFKLLLAIASHRHPLHTAVSDKNLGAEKLDYLERDGLVTILSRPVGVAYLRHHIYFTGSGIAIDEKVVDNAIEIQNFYLKMYKNVYLRKTSVIAQRMMQKIVHYMILANEISREDLPNLTDSELIGIMHLSGNPLVKNLYGLLKRRDLFREAVVIRPEQFAHAEARPGKNVVVFGATNKQMKQLSRARRFRPENQAGLAALEEKIASFAGMSPESVLAVPIMNSGRFEAQDVMIYQGSGKKPASLKSRYPAHFKNIEEVAQTYLAFRICTTEEYRKILGSPRVAKKIFALLTG
jgi:HD superfamily phosphohydrolase